MRPTLVVGIDEAGGQKAYENILVAVDGVSGTAGDTWMVPEYRGYVLGEARRELTTLLPPDAAGDIKVRVATGRAAAAIRAHADDVDADLIVMGRSKRFMHLGSIARRVLRGSDRALLVIPPPTPARTMAADRRVSARAA